MVTFRQLWCKNKLRGSKFHKCRTPSLKQCPQKRGVVTNIVIIKPKKPNSAKRHIAGVKLAYGKKIRAAIPGEYPLAKSRTLKQYSKVIVRGGRARDIIGVRYKIILGLLDAERLISRKTSRSKYGAKKPLLNFS